MTEENKISPMDVIGMLAENAKVDRESVSPPSKEQISKAIDQLSSMDAEELDATLTTPAQIAEFKRLLKQVWSNRDEIGDADVIGMKVQTLSGLIDQLEQKRTTELAARRQQQ